MPDPGVLKKYRPPKGIGIRVDDGYEEKMEVPVEYDPLIAKLISYGANRDEAIFRMKRAIDEYEIEGVCNTLEFGRVAMNDKNFCDGDFDTSFISGRLEEIKGEACDHTESMIAAIVGNEFVESLKSEKQPKIPTIKSRWRERMK